MTDIKFELNRLTNYSDEEIIREIQRVAKLISTPWITGQELDKHSKVSASTIRNRFGWKNALEQAGLANRFAERNLQATRDSGRRFSNEEFITELRRVAQMHDNQPLTQEIFNQHGQMHAETIRRRFGSWAEALERAGLEVIKRRYTNDEYWENLLQVWMHYGRQPTYGEMDRSPSIIKARSYEAKWGKWTNALRDFVEYANTDKGDDSSTTIQENAPSSQESVPQKIPERVNKKTISSQDRRGVSQSLRIKVMYRDHFKCVLCGNSPSASHGLRIHIDHIIPYSKGGKTVMDNLRTLCEPCNLGRGNRYMD